MRWAHTIVLACSLLLAPFFASALTLSPVKIEVRGEPGQTLGGEIELYNEQSIAKTLYASYENFEPSGDGGTPRFVGSANGLATWMNAESNITLLPGEKRIVPYSISIPATAEAGGYFGAIFYGEADPTAGTAGSEVAIGGKLGTLVLLSVNGEVEESGGLNDFMAEQGRFLVELPVSFTFRMKNDGADRIVPLGDVRITNTFGLTSAVLPANKLEGSVLPASTRKFTTTWEPSTGLDGSGFFSHVRMQWQNLHIGWYTAHAEVTWGTERNVSTARYDFILFPWQLVLVCTIGVLGLMVALRFYNRWIVARSRP